MGSSLIPLCSLSKEESRVDWSPRSFSLSTISSLFLRPGFLPGCFVWEIELGSHPGSPSDSP
jgi:hypothetical protein